MHHYKCGARSWQDLPNIKTTVIDGDEDGEDFDPYGFMMTVHPTRGSRLLKCSRLGGSDVLMDIIREAHKDVMDCLNSQNKEDTDDGQSMEQEGDDGVLWPDDGNRVWL